MAEMTTKELDVLERYVREQKRKQLLGEAIRRNDFIEWARHTAAFLLDKIEDAWRWVRELLRLD